MSERTREFEAHRRMVARQETSNRDPAAEGAAAARRDVALADALEEVAAILDEPRYEQLEALADLIQRLIAQDAVK